MGCSKNRVDSEMLIRQLTENGYDVYYEAEKGKYDYVAINTCGFIDDAKTESIEIIFHYIEEKAKGKIGKIVVFGCLSERYKKDLIQEMPEVDAWFGKFELEKMLEYFGAKYYDNLMPMRTVTTPKHYAYVKISEGCNRTCSFCAIPRITGCYKSRKMEDIMAECQCLVNQGAKELILIAQDLSFYGCDIYKKPMLAQLMEQIATQIKGLHWLRIHYTYPAHFPLDILDVMAKYPNICKYIDIALQHISTPVLKAMRRNIGKDETMELIEQFRKRVPNLTLRTTLLVGHPGETEDDFNQLMDFVKTVRFDRLGVFAYSNEEGTYAFENYDDNIPQEVKQQRVDAIMELQQKISTEINQQKIGKDIEVLIDRKEGEYYVGRSQGDSPDVDGEVLIDASAKLKLGDFVTAKIYDADEYDLYAKIITE